MDISDKLQPDVCQRSTHGSCWCRRCLFCQEDQTDALKAESTYPPPETPSVIATDMSFPDSLLFDKFLGLDDYFNPSEDPIPPQVAPSPDQEDVFSLSDLPSAINQHLHAAHAAAALSNDFLFRDDDAAATTAVNTPGSAATATAVAHPRPSLDPRARPASPKPTMQAHHAAYAPPPAGVPAVELPTAYNTPLVPGGGLTATLPAPAPSPSGSLPPRPPAPHTDPSAPDDWASRLAFARQHLGHLEVFDRNLLRDAAVPADASDAVRRRLQRVNAEFQDKRAHRARLRNNSSARRSRAARQERLDRAEATVGRLTDDLAAARRAVDALRRVCADAAGLRGPDLDARLDRALADLAADAAHRERERMGGDDADNPADNAASRPAALPPAGHLLPQISEADMRLLMLQRPPPQEAFAGFAPPEAPSWPGAEQYQPVVVPDDDEGVFGLNG